MTTDGKNWCGRDRYCHPYLPTSKRTRPHAKARRRKEVPLALRAWRLCVRWPWEGPDCGRNPLTWSDASDPPSPPKGQGMGSPIRFLALSLWERVGAGRDAQGHPLQHRERRQALPRPLLLRGLQHRVARAGRLRLLPGPHRTPGNPRGKVAPPFRAALCRA